MKKTKPNFISFQRNYQEQFRKDVRRKNCEKNSKKSTNIQKRYLKKRECIIVT